MGGGKDQNQNQNICENNMLSALKKFNDNINNGNNSNLKQELGKLQEKLKPAGDKVGEKFKEAYNSVVNLIGECAEKNPANFNISSDQDPLSQMCQEIVGKKIPSESVKQKHWDGNSIGITDSSPTNFPAQSTSLKKALKKFLINLLEKVYPNKKTVSESKQGMKKRNMKTIKTAAKTNSVPKSQNTNKRPSSPSQSPKIKNHQSQGKRSVIKTSKHDSANPQKLTEVQPLEKMETSPNFNPSQESIKVSQMKSTNLSKQTNSGEGNPVNLNKSIEGPKNVQSNHESSSVGLPSKNEDILNNFNKFHYNINNIINNNMEKIRGLSTDVFKGVYEINDETYNTYIIKPCNECITELKNEITNRGPFANLTENESNSIAAIQDCLNKFLKNPQIFDKEVDKTAPILVLFEKLTGSSATLKDITNSYGDPSSSIAIKNMKISEDKDFNKSFKNCLAALMRIYNVRNNMERFAHFVTNMGGGGYGVANSYQLSNNGKEVVAKTFYDPNKQEQDASELIANTKIYHKTLKLKEKEKEKQNEIEKLEQELNQTKDPKRIRELEQEIENLKLEKKALKSNRNRVINVKMRGNIIETKKGTGDLLKFMEKDMWNIYDKCKEVLTEKEITDCMTGLIDDTIKGVKQFHDTYKRVHRDIKTENFFVYPKNTKKEGSLLDYKCKLADCDSSAKINGKFKYKFYGTPQFKPELFTNMGKENKIARRLCIEYANGKPGAALAVAEDNYALYETLDEITCILEEYVIKVNQSLFEASYNYAYKQSQNLLKENNNFSMFESIEKLKDFLIENGAPKDELNNKLAKLNGSEKLDEDATDRILKEYYEMQNNSSELSNE